MPTTECGLFRRAASSRCERRFCSRARARTSATARDVELRRAFIFYALRFTERNKDKSLPPRLDFLSCGTTIRYMRHGNKSRREIIRWLWHVVRLPIVMLLVILEPVVALLCGALALLGVLTTVFFKLIAAPHFPTWTMLAISISFGLALVLYEGAITLLSD